MKVSKSSLSAPAANEVNLLQIPKVLFAARACASAPASSRPTDDCSGQLLA
jgi:hypothetical protein